MPDVSTRMVELPSGSFVRVLESGPPHGPSVLLIHGLGGSAYHFRKNFRALVSRGVHAVAIDLPGHGLSEKPREPERYTLAALVKATVQTLDALGLSRVAVVGQSLGGMVAIRMALDHPARVGCLALISAVGVAAPRLATWGASLLPGALATVMPALARRTVFRAMLWLVYGEPERPTDRDVDEAWAATEESAYSRAVFHVARHVSWAPPTSELGSLRAPLLVICGERDHIVPPSRARTLSNVVPAARLVVIPRGGHAVNEGNPGAVNALLADFVAGSIAPVA